MAWCFPGSCISTPALGFLRPWGFAPAVSRPAATLLTAFLLILFTLADPCFGAWMSGKQAPRSGWFSEERKLLGDQQYLHKFSLYDNLSQPLSADAAPVVLCPANRRFVPLALFDRNPQLRNIIPRPASLEVQMADKIYANLKLKEILDQYEELRERSQRVLKGLLAPEPEKRMPTLTPSLVNLAATHPATAVPSISERLAELAAAQRQVGARITAGWSEPREALREADASLHSLAEEAKDLKSIQMATTTNSSSAQKLARLDAILEGKITSNKLESPEAVGIHIDANRRTALDDEANELPWIIRFLLAAVQFVFSHKYEVLAGFLTVLAFAVVVSVIGVRSRR